MASLLLRSHSYHWSHRPSYFTINASLLAWSILLRARATVDMFLWLCVSDLWGFSWGLWICHCGRRFSHFKTVLIASGAWCRIFKLHMYGFFKKRKKNNTLQAQPANSSIITLLTNGILLFKIPIPPHWRPNKTYLPKTACTRQRGWRQSWHRNFL